MSINDGQSLVVMVVTYKYVRILFPSGFVGYFFDLKLGKGVKCSIFSGYTHSTPTACHLLSPSALPSLFKSSLSQVLPWNLSLSLMPLWKKAAQLLPTWRFLFQ